MGFGEWNENRKREKMIREEKEKRGKMIRDRTEKANATREAKKVTYEMDWGCMNCRRKGTIRIPDGYNAEAWLSQQSCPNCKNNGSLVPNYED